jgi:A/G-specific adenine glycosylase
MLQQTQVDRVIPKYEYFIKRFPSFAALAAATLGDVLVAWQGLGYNRRAKMLHQCAGQVLHRYNGVLPSDEQLLRQLPGIGEYTARAVLAFAFQVPLPLVETNVRTVYIYHFFSDQNDVTDAALRPYIERTLSQENPRDWYYAVMDYGSYIKRTRGNNISRSKQYKPQSAFKGSDRQVRGAIIRALTSGPQTKKKLRVAVPCDGLQFDAQLERLVDEAMIEKVAQSYRLPC